MKEEVKIKYLVILYLSKFNGGFLQKNKGGSKADYERLCHVPEKNREFRKWLDELIKFGVLESFEKSDRGFNLFVVNKKNTQKMLKQFKIDQDLQRVYYDRYESF